MNRSTASLKHIISAYVAPRKFTFDFAAETPKGEGVISTDLKGPKLDLCLQVAESGKTSRGDGEQSNHVDVLG